VTPSILVTDRSAWGVRPSVSVALLSEVFVSVTPDGCVIKDSSAFQGGGTFNDSEGTLTVRNCTFSHNSAFNGAGLETSGVATVTDSTFNGNVASNAGGAVFNRHDEESQPSRLTLLRDTVAGNSAAAAGGLFNYAFLA